MHAWACVAGAYQLRTGAAVFRRVEAPSKRKLQALLERLAERIGRALQRAALLERDAEQSYLALEPQAGGAMDGRPA